MRLPLTGDLSPARQSLLSLGLDQLPNATYEAGNLGSMLVVVHKEDAHPWIVTIAWETDYVTPERKSVYNVLSTEYTISLGRFHRNKWLEQLITTINCVPVQTFNIDDPLVLLATIYSQVELIITRQRRTQHDQRSRSADPGAVPRHGEAHSATNSPP